MKCELCTIGMLHFDWKQEILYQIWLNLSSRCNLITILKEMKIDFIGKRKIYVMPSIIYPLLYTLTNIVKCQ